MSDPIRLGLIGAGTFVRRAHMPSLAELGDMFEVAAVYSRTQSTAQALADDFTGTTPDTMTDLDALLARDDIEALDVVLPIPVMMQTVKKALASGKHVISEKPIATDIDGARTMLNLPLADHQVWMIAENWRYEPAYVEMARLVREGAIGQVMHVSFAVNTDIAPGSHYHQTKWRREASFPGGFLLDGGVHHIAVLRMIVGEIAGVGATVAQMRDDLPPADTLAAALRFESGVVGAYTASYAADAGWSPDLCITGTAGSLRGDRSRVLRSRAGDDEETVFTSHPQGVARELEAFAAAIRNGEPHRNLPLEAARDLAVIEAMLHSAETGQHRAPESIS